jgi:hypothetical protein
MKTHELKTWPVFYEKIIDGSKSFEVRNNDRNFQVNDILFLREYDPDAEDYTGRSCKVRVTYILGDNPFFQINNNVIMGIASLSTDESKEDAKDQIIKKQEELIERFLKSGVQIHSEGKYTEYQKLKDELFDLQCSLEQSEQKVSDEEILEPIENALFATNRFSTDVCTTLAEGILTYLRDADFVITKTK